MSDTARPVTPRDAAAVILLDEPDDLRVFWARRAPAMAFQGGFHAFPGGQRSASDAEVPVENRTDEALDLSRIAAARELFEETGVLLADGAERIDREDLRELRRRLVDGGEDFGELLTEKSLAIDLSLLAPAGRWVTPAYSPRRFDTLFFTAWLPADQRVEELSAEFDRGGWARPADALAEWQTGTILAAPPIVHALRVLAEGVENMAERFAAIPEARGGEIRRTEFRPGVVLFLLRTPTQPPATHTNCYVVGGARELVVIDPGSPYAEEQKALDDLLDELAARGRRVREILITHLHPDHVGGANHLRERLNVPVAAHRLTAEAIVPDVRVDRFVEDGERFDFEGPPDVSLVALHTPGHARGHLCFRDERTGSLLTGDLIVGIGSVVIDPPEGHLGDYMRSLARVRALDPTALFCGHGPVVGNAVGKIDEYAAHRLDREREIVAALAGGAGTPEEIVEVVYADVAPKLHGLARRSVLAHLAKLAEDGAARAGDDGRWFLP